MHNFAVARPKTASLCAAGGAISLRAAYRYLRSEESELPNFFDHFHTYSHLDKHSYLYPKLYAKAVKCVPKHKKDSRSEFTKILLTNIFPYFTGGISTDIVHEMFGYYSKQHTDLSQPNLRSQILQSFDVLSNIKNEKMIVQLVNKLPSSGEYSGNIEPEIFARLVTNVKTEIIRKEMILLGLKKGYYTNCSTYKFLIYGINDIKLLQEILTEIKIHQPSNRLFSLVKSIIRKSKIPGNYSRHTINYGNFMWLAERKLIDPKDVADYLSVVMKSKDFDEHKMKEILNHLMKLNPLDEFSRCNAIFSGLYLCENDSDYSLFQPLIETISDAKLLAQIITAVNKRPLSNGAFTLVKKIITKKRIEGNYSRYVSNFDNFAWFTERDLINSYDVVDYFQTVLGGKDFREDEVKEISRYLIKLNPLARGEMTIGILEVMERTDDVEKRRFLSQMIRDIGYKFSKEERGELYSRLYDGVSQLQWSHSRTVARSFIQFIRTEHPEIDL
ncbi:MAG: hypothetical protein Harvfovirus3_25 [Harvfovirus sp.]|uniref:Uncharacterized protein n=1 Tax=Harvfovirus sp. TaxID=2487768 RepID=A0A3G5A0C3_9VIRU|nr:MAG: hypothetical protein Harvfovirus3_25 [Harvfovirus sp.]